MLFSVSVPDVVPPRPSLWKLNTSVLDEADYVSLVSGFLASSEAVLAIFGEMVGGGEV